MKLRRLPPLAVAFALMAAALVATTLATSHTINNTYTVVANGQAITAEEALRADLIAEYDGAPTSEELMGELGEHATDGVRYIAIIDPRGGVIEAGKPLGTLSAAPRRQGRGLEVEELGDRIRVEMRVASRRGRRNAYWLVVEVESSEAKELRGASRRTMAIGLLAAFTLLAVAIALVRRELRRQATERARERERRLAALGEMSAVLAHEIKNPLASLKGNAQLLAALLPQGEKSRAKADRVVDEAVRLEKLTQDLLAFVRTGQIERTSTEPAIVARDAASAVTGEIVVDAAPGLKPWSLDGARMREVLINLIDNAVAAGPPVRVGVAIEGTTLVYEVIDNGPGVPAAERDKIFEPFHTGKTRGTGLGLAIAKRLVDLHHGTIAVDDAPAALGRGARFRVVIPEG